MSRPDRQARTEEAARRKRVGRPPLDPSQDTVTVQVRLLRETRDALRALPRPMSESVREAVEEWLDSQPDGDR